MCTNQVLMLSELTGPPLPDTPTSLNVPAGPSPPNPNIRSTSTAAAIPLRAVGIGARCSQVLVAGFR
jgi:hypothetical protein